jgi:L-fuculose-phosphate aldolase
MNEVELREQMCMVGHLMHQNGYIDGKSGNLSARLDSDRILATPSGVAKGFMTPNQLIVVDMDGNAAETSIQARPTSELLMHLECYRQRPDIDGVVHAHPPTAVALTLVGYDFQQCILPEMVMLLGFVPTIPYATPASSENLEAISQLVVEHDAIMLSHHGSLTVATSLWDAYLRLEGLEHSARTLYMAAQMPGEIQHISPAQVEKVIAIRKRLGLWKPGDEERFRTCCGMG